MKTLRTVFLIFNFLFLNILLVDAQSRNKASMPYDIVFIGYDNDIGGINSEKIGLLTMTEINQGYTFGLINKVYSSGKWEAANNDELVQTSFKLKSGVAFKKGTLLEIKNLNGQIYVYSDNTDVSGDFEISGLKDSSYRFLKTTGSYLSLHSGYFLTSQREILLGTVLDIISVGISRQSMLSVDLGTSLDDKDTFTTDDPNDGGGNIDISNCRLCDLLLIILDPDNWEFAPGTSQDDVDLSDFNLEECAEVDCEGILSIDTLKNELIMTQSPCGREIMTYQWQKWVNGMFVTIDQGNGPLVPPYDLSKEECSNQTYRLIVICENGCEYEEVKEIKCTPECEMSFSVDVDSCTLTAIVVGCANPKFNWWHVESGASVGDEASITADKDGNYYVVVSGCDGCEPDPSDYFYMKGCKSCDCSQAGLVDSCVIYFDTIGCVGYFELWEYSPDNTNWEVVNFQGNVYEPEHDGYYRRTLSEEGCEDVATTVMAECVLTCQDFTATPDINEDCQIEIDYEGCMDIVEIQISYSTGNSVGECDSSQSYEQGGGFVVNDITSGLSGTIIIEPEFENTCYLITLTCSNGCEIEVYVWNGQCCQGNLAIEDIDCEIHVSGLPCTGTFAYTWSIDGVPQPENSGQSIPPLIPTVNGDYELEVICPDSCVYYSNEIEIECVDPPCDSQVQIIPDECILTASVTNCPNALFQWQIDLGNGFEDIPGETEQTYTATSNDPLKVIVTNCENCENEEVSFEYTPVNCDDMCDCDTNVWVDANCVLQSSDTDCQNVWWSSWWKSDDGGITWYNFPESAWQSSFVPPSNGLYKKLLELDPSAGCPNVEDEVNVECLQECDDVIIIFPQITNDCHLKASWKGCFDLDENDIGWYFTNNADCPSDNGITFPTTLPYQDSIFQYEINLFDGTGFLTVVPEQGPGCYFFNMKCGGCEVIQTWIDWDYCCVECTPEFILTEDCLIEFDSESDENCFNNLISNGYTAHYYYASTEMSFVEITAAQYYTPTTSGWYKVQLVNPNCATIETSVIFADDSCPFNGQVSYDCDTGISFNMTSGTAPYTYAWGYDPDYPSLNGTPIQEGDLLPYNEFMPIIATDANGLTFQLSLSIECLCWGSNSVDVGNHPRVFSWNITQNGNSYQYFGDWSDDPICNSPQSLEDLENNIKSVISNICISSFDPFVNVYELNNNKLGFWINMDQYCGFESLELVVVDCISNNRNYATSSFSCSEYEFKTTSITSHSGPNNKSLSIYPNPTQNSFTLKTSPVANEYVTIKIYTIQGQLVKTKKVRTRSDHEYQMDSSTLESGIYLVGVESGNVVIGYEKLIIIH
ncbi:MAG: T9SS type A sorting domain-containing protein [Bacteroidota bacterium]